MRKYYKTISGVKFYCKENGELEVADGQPVAVDETKVDTTTLEEVKTEENKEEAVEEVAKMIGEATQRAYSQGAKNFTEAVATAKAAVAEMLAGIGAATKSAIPQERKASIDAEAVKANLLNVKAGKQTAYAFEIKSAADLEILSKSTDKTDFTGDVLAPEKIAEPNRAPTRQAFIEQISNTAPTEASELSYVEVVNETGAPAPTAELAEMPEKDFKFQEFRAPVKKITVTNKHSAELLADAPQLVAAIKNWLKIDLNLAVDEQLLKGNGTGANLNGVMTLAAAFGATEVGTKRVANANLFDVIRVVLTHIAVVGKGKFVPSHIVLNPGDADELDLTKDEQGRYVLPPFITADGLTIKGVRIIENVGITAGKFLIGDFSKFNVAPKGGVEIEVTNADGTDFAKDIISVKLRRRVAAYLRLNDNGAIVTGDIADVKAALIAA